MRNPKRSIVIISAPRSGTNYFCDTMEAFSEIAGLFEIFNPRGVFGASGYPELFTSFLDGNPKLVEGTPIAEQPVLIRTFRDQPVASVQILEEDLHKVRKEYISYKIFPNQIPDEKLTVLLRELAAAAIFIVRSRIATFISFKKAMLTDQWHNTDTRDMKLSLDLQEFLSWCEGHDAWFHNTSDIAMRLRIPSLFISYESDINMDKENLVEKILLGMRSIGVSLHYPDTMTHAKFRKQDTQGDPFDKLENGTEIREALSQQGLLDYALSNPLVRNRPSV